MKTIKLLAITMLALAACGDNKSVLDASVNDARPDSMVPFPAAPTLGAQIDRMGRPAVNTALNHGFDPTQAGKDAKDAYNAMSDKAAWLAPANVGEFMKNLAMIDVLDTGVCGNGLCEASEANVADGTHTACTLDCGAGVVGGTCGDGICAAGESDANCPTTSTPPGDCRAGETGSGIANGCRNNILYNGLPGGGAPAATSYATLAGLLADDELYVDTGAASCIAYLAVEAEAVIDIPPTCGGRSPEYDVIDYSYSMLAMGLKGFNIATTPFTALVTDGATVHADVDQDVFPYLGAPNP